MQTAQQEVKPVRVLEFEVHSHDIGRNTTVRLGTKWLHRVEPGDSLILREVAKTEADGTPAKRLPDISAIVVSVWCGLFEDVTDDMLSKEHDFECRIRSGLFEKLKAVYGDAIPNGEDFVVTVVEYEVPR